MTLDIYKSELPRAYGGPLSSGRIKSIPDDFIVEELLGFELSGDGEHEFLFVRKSGENTEFTARLLAEFANVNIRDVSYAGLKDRHGITSQWFSIHLPGNLSPNWEQFNSPSVEVLFRTRNKRKLRKGAAKGNRFKLTIRDLVIGCPEAFEEILWSICRYGIPNYFGEQRFGWNGQNLEKALSLFRDSGNFRRSHKNGLYISAARSEIYNRILALRVEQNLWNKAVDGDVFMFQGSHSFFVPEKVDDLIHERVEELEIHPGGSLWGFGNSPISAMALDLESQAILGMDEFMSGLENLKVEKSMRPLRVCPAEMTWSFVDSKTLNIEFVLPPGAYATAVLHELICFIEP